MAVPVKDAVKRDSLKPLPGIVCIRSDDGPFEDLPAGQARSQVDVGGQDEMLIIIVGILAEQHQVLGRGDLVRIVSLARAAAVFGIGRKA